MKLYVIGNQLIEQTYKELEVIRLTSIKQLTLHKDDKSDFYGYLLPYHRFTQPNSLEIIVGKLKKQEKIFGAYTDTINQTNNTIQFQPAYHPDGLSRVICNNPLFSKQALQFDEQIEDLIFYDLLLSTRNKVIWHHEPQPLISLSPIQLNISKDLRILKKKYGLGV